MKINSKIVGFAVVKEQEAVEVSAPVPVVSTVIESRPELVEGKTYKLKPGSSDHAFYVTINNVVDVNGVTRPIEMFVVSKDIASFQWISALARLVSAVFRHTPDVRFIADELKEVFDPQGGYFIPGSKGKRANSIVAHIGHVLGQHLDSLNVKPVEAVEVEAAVEAVSEDEGDSYPASATTCSKCHTRAVIVTEGCEKCLDCGFSKCG